MVITRCVNPSPFKGLQNCLHIARIHTAPISFLFTLLLPHSLLQPLAVLWLVSDAQISKQRPFPVVPIKPSPQCIVATVKNKRSNDSIATTDICWTNSPSCLLPSVSFLSIGHLEQEEALNAGEMQTVPSPKLLAYEVRSG